MAPQKSVAFFFLINLCVVLCVSLPWTYKQTGETGTFYDKVKFFFRIGLLCKAFFFKLSDSHNILQQQQQHQQH